MGKFLMILLKYLKYIIFFENYEFEKLSPEVILQVKLNLPVIELRYKVALE